jgi:OmpA-OmpF porin, OOP family
VSTCINSDTFWPNPGPSTFPNVGGTQTVTAGQVGFGLVTSYQSRPLLLDIPSPGPGGSRQFVVDNQVTGNFLWAYGVTSKLQLDVALPLTFVQSGAGTSPVTGGAALRDTALRDMRFGLVYAIIPRERIDPLKAAREGGAGKAFSLAGRMTFVAPTGDSAELAGDRTAVFAPSIVADYRIARFVAGADLGARMRPVTEFAGTRVGTQIGTALGVGYEVLDRELLTIMLEGRALWNVPEQRVVQQSAFGLSASDVNGKRIVPAEWMLSARTAPLLGGDVAFTIGGGGPLPLRDGSAFTPRFRFLLGVAYAPVDKDSDGDGVPDRLDRCPNEPGPKRGERPGCPDAGQAQ